mgnify:CR=1 FL=1
MTGTLLLALGVAAGVPPALVAASAVAWSAPWWAALGVAVLAVFDRRRVRRPVDRRLEVLGAITADLRSGRSLRSALYSACHSDATFARVARRARLGLPMGEVVADLAAGFGNHGPLVAASLALADRAGGSATEALDTVARLIRDDGELADEVRAGSAPAKVSLVAVIAAPLAFLGLQVAGGSLTRSVASPGGFGLAVGGTVLIGLGVAVSLLLARGSR